MKRLLTIATLILLSSFQIVSAEIASPYVVDEKPQVLFGDSTSIAAASSTYEGLENYTHDYVNDYLHITYTYTHSRFGTSDYSPRLYITGEDPQSTTTPDEKDRSVVYQLLAVPVPPGHETDWYSYDIQFDSTGYTVSVLEGGATSTASFHTDVAGLAETDWAALANLYPNTGTAFSMAFTPLPIYNAPTSPAPTPTATTKPVIIVPGVLSSVLYFNGSEIWPNVSGLTFSLNDSFLDDLALNSDFQSTNSINAVSVLRNLAGQNFFDGLFSSLETSGYVENESVFEFPYDWRLDIGDLATQLKQKIDEVKSERGVDKVDLVAHSMGGLLVKEYLKEYGGESVDKFIDIATPHTGAPKAYKILSYGDNFGFEKAGLNFLNPTEIKQISQNMPSVYELLPSRNYFDSSDSAYSYYVFNDSAHSPYLSFDETEGDLASAGRNSALLARADAFHQGIDGLDPSAYGVMTYNIVGCGVPTIGQFYTFHDSNGESHNLRFVDGDGTVPLKSAEAITASKTYYVAGAVHALLPSTEGVKELVAGLLTATSTDFDISSYSSLSTTASNCSIPDGMIVSFHSPVTLDIYDSSGNHAGPDTNGDIENNISGVSYESLGDEKFAYLPKGTDYTVRGTATGPGDLTVRIEDVVDGEVATTTVFAGIPVTPIAKVEFSLDTDGPSNIPLDADGDGTFEKNYSVSTSTVGMLEASGEPVIVPDTSPLPVRREGSSRPPTPIATSSLANIATTSLAISTTTSQSATTSTSSLQIKQKPKLRQAPPLVEHVSSSTASQNVAAASQAVTNSIGTKIKNAFHKLWSWLRGR